MQRLGMLWRFLLFYLRANTIYKVHSPFVFKFCEQVLEDKRWYYAFSMVEPVRQAMLQNYSTIEVTDLGAGSAVQNSKQRQISKIAESAVSPSHQCRQLFRIINHFKPDTLLEMGSSLGISSMYQAMARLNGRMVTLEGCENIARLAKQNFKQLKLNNINLITGPFDNSLLQAFDQLKQIDYAFIDGNHQKAATLSYFQQCLKHAKEQSVFIFDDIYWSADMAAAWEEIKQHPQVTISIDLYFMGLVFFRKEQKEKAHYRLVPARWKRWQLGFLSSSS